MARILQPNNFDHLRLFLALSVACVHAATLSGEPQLAWMNHCFNSKLAVDGFFIISGCMVTASYERSRSWRDYLGKRARRIYPGYVAVIIASLLLGACITSSAQYWQEGTTWRYLAANLVFLNFLAPLLPGVFDASPVNMHAVNGALYTIKIEVLFYLLLPFLVLLHRKTGVMRLLAGLYILSCLYYYAAAPLSTVLARQLPGQLRYFAVGMALYYFGDAWRKYLHRLLIPAAIIVGFYSFDVDALPLETIYPAAVGVLVAWVAYGLPRLGNLMRVGDISYGVYIVHFPLIQLAVQMGWLNTHPLAGAALVGAVVVALAIALWHLVEKPALRADSHYRQKI